MAIFDILAESSQTSIKTNLDQVKLQCDSKAVRLQNEVLVWVFIFLYSKFYNELVALTVCSTSVRANDEIWSLVMEIQLDSSINI